MPSIDFLLHRFSSESSEIELSDVNLRDFQNTPTPGQIDLGEFSIVTDHLVYRVCQTLSLDLSLKCIKMLPSQ